jgi:ATP-binding cassette subfamily F protein uup
LILVSHDRDFIDRLATSTIALDGRGSVVETPGGWTDFVRQNPGFFAHPEIEAPRPAATPTAAPAPKRAAKLSYKDQRRLELLETLVPELTEKIRAEEDHLHDPGLYARDPAGFDRLMKSLDALRAQLAAAEEEWLALEEKREALAGA